jgi:hypothetical protein
MNFRILIQRVRVREREKEIDLAKLASASDQVDDAGSEGLEIGFVGRGFLDQTTLHGNSATQPKEFGVAEPLQGPATLKLALWWLSINVQNGVGGF